MSMSVETGIYLGSRGADFKELISGLLKRGNLKKKYIKILTDTEAMEIYGNAFTSELVDPNNNYQVLEQIGDLTGNKFIVNYMYGRFPQLLCTEGVKIVARLRINYGAKTSFCEIARKLGFWPFISSTNELRQRKMKPLLEDVFEAFLGATEMIIDNRKRVGVGYGIVYSILKSIFDEIDISLQYEDLYDAKTRLKELFDMYETTLGPLVYKETKQDMITTSCVFRIENVKYKMVYNQGNLVPDTKTIVGGLYVKIGEGQAALKADAQQNAAADALINLKTAGWYKEPPSVYKKFDTKFNENPEEKIEVSVEKDIMKWGNDINALQNTKEKNKYQSKYQSTLLAMYCRLRNLSGVVTCLNMGADPNIIDSEGLYPLDLLLIGKVDESTVSKILKNFNKVLKVQNKKINISQQVFDMYYSSYIHKSFKKCIKNMVVVKTSSI